MKIKKLKFTGSQGFALGAQLDLPEDGEALAYALFAHCFTCGKDLKAMRNISLALTAARMAVLRFDFTGLGESEGDFAETGFLSNVEDLVAAAAFMSAELRGPELLIGHSLGGTAAVLAAPRIPSCRAVSTIASPANLAGLERLLAGPREEIEKTGSARVQVAGREFKLGRALLEDVDAGAGIAGLDLPLLILHSPRDEMVPIDRAAELFKAARHPKSFVALGDADHLLTEEADSLYAGRVIAAWASRYLGGLD